MNTQTDDCPPSLTDSHCHLTFPELITNLPAVLDRARTAGLTRMITVGQGLEDSDQAIQLARQHPQISASVGFGPHDSARVAPDHFEKLAALAAAPEVVALGELGLDYHHDLSPRDIQREVFTRQLTLATSLNLPLIIHCRDAWPDCLAILDKAHLPPTPGLFHCYTGPPKLIPELIDRGFYISFAGIITFPTAHACRDAAKKVPLNRLLIETDAPYLSPEPFRKTRPNHPALLVHTASFLAQLLDMPATKLARFTTKNATDLFSLSPHCD